jgi:Zn-finger nucleic acid-binding protein
MAAKKKVIIRPPEPKHRNDEVRPSGERPCPVCKEALGSKLDRGISLDVCEQHGVWFDRGELDRLLANVTRSAGASRRTLIDRARKRGVTLGLFAGMWALLDKEPSRRVAPPRTEWASAGAAVPAVERAPAGGRRSCPVCDAAMKAEAVDDVVVDTCEQHGVWLDAGELQQMIDRVRAHVRNRVASAAAAARRQGVVEANIFGLFAYLR